ncbi:hypothetical protein F5878DRAFT_679507, partial [Lentinula raphanica]
MEDIQFRISGDRGVEGKLMKRENEAKQQKEAIEDFPAMRYPRKERVQDTMERRRANGLACGVPRKRSFGGVRGSVKGPRVSKVQGNGEERARGEIVSLQDLYSGAVKYLKVGRKLLNGTTEDKVLDIQVHPGWKSGTMIRFARAGNEQVNGEAQDLVFVVEEKAHISLREALTHDGGGKKQVEMLDGRKIQ